LSHSVDPVPLHPTPTRYRGTILVASPHPVSHAFLLDVLRDEASEVFADCGIAACTTQAEKHFPDLIVIDGMASRAFTVELLRAVRSHEVVGQSGVIVLSENRDDEVHTLEAGADDFIMVPLHRQNFLLRVRGVVRRVRRMGRFLHYDDVTMDMEQHRVSRDGRPIDLGPVQFRLLRHFLENSEQFFSLEQLGDVVWSDGAGYRTARTVYVYIHLLRKQLNAGGKPDLIHTERGGFRFGSAKPAGPDGTSRAQENESPESPAYTGRQSERHM
jgi:two-component system phosphate regulon response regulator PhoB